MCNVFRRSASSSAATKACSAAAMSERRRAETCASIYVTLLVIATALKGVGRDVHMSWGARTIGSAGPDWACSED